MCVRGWLLLIIAVVLLLIPSCLGNGTLERDFSLTKDSAPDVSSYAWPATHPGYAAVRIDPPH